MGYRYRTLQATGGRGRVRRRKKPRARGPSAPGPSRKKRTVADGRTKGARDANRYEIAGENVCTGIIIGTKGDAVSSAAAAERARELLTGTRTRVHDTEMRVRVESRVGTGRVRDATDIIVCSSEHYRDENAFEPKPPLETVFVRRSCDISDSQGQK